MLSHLVRATGECRVLLALAFVAACGGDSESSDAGADDVVDAAAAGDAAASDASADDGAPADGQDGSSDGPVGSVDAADFDAPIPDANLPDAWSDSAHVDIYIDNFCNVGVVPGSFTVPAGETLSLTWHNNSVDYEADVWLSYGGGYLDLAQGGIWADSFEFCSMPGPYEAGADVGPASVPDNVCPHYYVQIHCQ